MQSTWLLSHILIEFSLNMDSPEPDQLTPDTSGGLKEDGLMFDLCPLATLTSEAFQTFATNTR